MKSCILPVLLLLSVASRAQIQYETGYFVDKDENRNDCLIRNVQWLNNPVEFNYRLSSEGQVLTVGLAEVNEFGLSGVKYIKATVNIDTSRQDLRMLSGNRHPEWKQQQVFLKVLVEGKANLFAYRSGNIEKFFYSVDGSSVEQLVYKRFLVNATDIGTNVTYVQQLMNDVACGGISEAQMKKVPYTKRSLVKYFYSFNVCNGGEPVVRLREQKLRWSVAPGIDFARFKVDNESGFEKEYADGVNVRFGFMAEYTLSFNKGKWAIIVEPTYQSYSAGNSVQYRSVEIPFGLRHHLFLNTNSRLFVSAFFVTDIPIQYEVVWSQTLRYKGNFPSGSFAAGIGFNHGKFSIEARKCFTRSVLDDANRFFFVYEKISGIVAYRIR